MDIPVRERAYATMIARQIHPDLDFGKPSKEETEMTKRYNLVDQLDDLRKVTLNFDLPSNEASFGGPVSTIFYCTVSEWDSTTYKSSINKNKTLATLRRYTRILKDMGCRIEKDYSDNYMKVYAYFESGLKITLTADREAVCKKKVVGQEWVEPMKGHYKEIVEWDCEPVSILAGD